MSDDLDKLQPRSPRSLDLWFAAFVGAVSVSMYQFGTMAAWGTLFAEPLQELLTAIVGLIILGAVYGIVAAGLYVLFRWLFKLDRPNDPRP